MVFLNHDQGLDDIYSNRLLEPDFYLSCNYLTIFCEKGKCAEEALQLRILLM